MHAEMLRIMHGSGRVEAPESLAWSGPPAEARRMLTGRERMCRAWIEAWGQDPRADGGWASRLAARAAGWARSLGLHPGLRGDTFVDGREGSLLEAMVCARRPRLLQQLLQALEPELAPGESALVVCRRARAAAGLDVTLRSGARVSIAARLAAMKDRPCLVGELVCDGLVVSFQGPEGAPMLCPLADIELEGFQVEVGLEGERRWAFAEGGALALPTLPRGLVGRAEVEHLLRSLRGQGGAQRAA